MLKRIIAAILGVFNAGNGVLMLIDGTNWYNRVPGVAETGPYNPHFVQDIGAAFLTAGLGLLAAAWRPRYWPAAAAGATFLMLHALIHVIGIAAGHSHTVGFELALVIVPALLAVYASLPPRGAAHA